MAFSYGGNPGTSQVDQLRFTLQDTDPAFPLLADEEYTWLAGQWLGEFESLTFVASIAAATIARKFTGLVSVSADGVSVNTSELSGRYTEMAKGLRQEYRDGLVGGSVVWNDDFPRRFRIGLHDAIEAGAQDFGDDPDPLAIAEYLGANGVFP